MSGFANQIIGGLSKLVRPAIQSPDYETAISGWSINKDGSAEFNNINIRGNVVITGTEGEILVYDGAPAAGNLILAVSGTSGVDSFGNNYSAGISIAATTGALGLMQWLNQSNPADPTSPPYLWAAIAAGLIQSIALRGPDSAGLNQGARITLGADKSLQMLGSTALNQYMTIDDNGYTFNPGPSGKFYSETVLMSAQTLTANNTSQLTNLSPIRLYSGYGSAWNLATGVWTAPAAGQYLVCMNPGYLSVPTGFAAHFPIMKQNGFQFSEGGAATILCTLTQLVDCLAGDQLTFFDLFTGTAGATTKIDNTSPKSCIYIKRTM